MNASQDTGHDTSPRRSSGISAHWGFAVLLLCSLVIGWCIPDFYDWTESDQSRPSPLLWQLPLSMLVAFLMIDLSLPWLPVLPPRLIGVEASAHRHRHGIPSTRWNFGSRFLMQLTALVAVLLAAGFRFPTIVSLLVFTGVLAWAIRVGVLQPGTRVAFLSLLGSMYLPYVWVADYEQLTNLSPQILTAMPGLPGLLPSLLLPGIFRGLHQDQIWLPTLISALELLLGIGAIYLGPKRTWAYVSLAMLCSSVGSLALHMMVRA